MTPGDGLPRFLARSAHRGDAAHRKAYTTLPESLGRPLFRSHMRPAVGCRNGLTMPRPVLLARGGRLRDLQGPLSTFLGIRNRLAEAAQRRATGSIGYGGRFLQS